MKQVICLGSFQGSDRLGWDIAALLDARLRAAGLAQIRVRTCASPAQLHGLLADTEAVVIVDALAGVPTGQVRMLLPEALRQVPVYSTHGVDLVTALELARALGELPAQVRIVGIGIGDPERDPQPSIDAVLPTVWSLLIAEFAA